MVTMVKSLSIPTRRNARNLLMVVRGGLDTAAGATPRRSADG